MAGLSWQLVRVRPSALRLGAVRCVLSLVNAQKQQPMPNPQTWLA